MAAATPTRAPLVPAIRSLRILWRILPYLLSAGVMIAGAALLEAPPAIQRQALVVGCFIVGFTLLMALIREVLSPRRAELRLIRMKDHRAERLAAVSRTLLFVLLGTELAIYLVEANGWHPSVARLLGLLRNLGLIVFAWSALNRSGLMRRLKPDDLKTSNDALRWLIFRIVLPMAFLAALFFAGARGFGYALLSNWVLKNAAWSALLIVVASLVYRWSRARLAHMVAFLQAEEAESEVEEAAAEHRLAREPSPTWIGVERIAAGGLKIAFVVGAFFVLLAVWELTLDAVRDLLATPIVAGWGPTYGAIVSAGLTIVTVLIVANLIKNLLIFVIFPRAGVDVGARYAVLAILRYIMWIIAGILTLDALGVDTGTFAVFAGAFGVGLAFGLQDIFANFFSGLIMLLERPVRVGDLIEVAGSSGRVEAIRLRGTTIRAFDNTTILIPNRQLIGERLTNLSHDMHFARMQLNVGVSYDADPREVQRILLKVAQADGRILANPAPVVRFTGFGDSSLDFSLRAYTSDTGGRWGIASDMHTNLFEALKAADIEIPFPQQDIHIRTSHPAGAEPDNRDGSSPPDKRA